MEYEVLYCRGLTQYIVKYKDNYYLVNTHISGTPIKSPYVDSFLKHGYFEPVTDIPQSDKERITQRLSTVK